MTATDERLRAKLYFLNRLCDRIGVLADLRTLAQVRMAEGDAKFGDAYKTEDLAVQEAEEQADQLCYRALRLLRGEKLTLRQRLGLRLWAIGMRWAR